MRYFKKLKGKRLYLSPINVEDYEIYTKWMNDLSTAIPLGQVTSNFGLIKEKKALEKMSQQDHQFAIVLNDGDQLLGNCSLYDVNHIHKTASLGLFIGDEDNRNKGYGSEAIQVILSYAFKILNLNNVMLKVFSFNERGIAAYRKIGFKEIGRRRQCYEMDDKYYDDVFMDILKSDFHSDYLKKDLTF